jgi:hypothetical protein
VKTRILPETDSSREDLRALARDADAEVLANALEYFRAGRYMRRRPMRQSSSTSPVIHLPPSSGADRACEAIIRRRHGSGPYRDGVLPRARAPKAQRASRMLTAVSLFSGAGGFCEGVRVAGWKVACAVEQMRKHA